MTTIPENAYAQNRYLGNLGAPLRTFEEEEYERSFDSDDTQDMEMSVGRAGDKAEIGVSEEDAIEMQIHC